jgi:hypothetical protein
MNKAIAAPLHGSEANGDGHIPAASAPIPGDLGLSEEAREDLDYIDFLWATADDAQITAFTAQLNCTVWTISTLPRFVKPKFQGHFVGILMAINDLWRSGLPVSGYILINLNASACRASASVTW